MKQADLDGLSPVQIKDKFALDFVPDKILAVNVPPDFTLRTGKVAPRPSIGTTGGKTQFELRQNLASSNFVNDRSL